MQFLVEQEIDPVRIALAVLAALSLSACSARTAYTKDGGSYVCVPNSNPPAVPFGVPMTVEDAKK